MIWIENNDLIIKCLRLRRVDPIGEYNFFLHYKMGNGFYNLTVEDTGDENTMVFVIPASFTSTLPTGEYAYSIVKDSQVVTSGVARKRELNFEADAVYSGTGDERTRYNVSIFASQGGYLMVNGRRYQNYVQSVPEGQILAVQAVSEAGYTFNGWSDEVEDNPRTITVTEDITLFAAYEAAEYTVSISAGSNGSVSVNGIVGDYTATLAYGTVLTILGLPNTGYTFTQWSDGNTDNPRTIIVTGPVTLASAYQVATQFYQVTVTAGQNGTVSVNGVAGNYSQTVIEGTVLTLEAVPNAGYDFGSWSDGNTSNPRTLVVNSAINLTSDYEAQTQYFSVNISAGSNGTVLVNGVVGDYSESVAEGTVVTIVGIPNTGYSFTQWSDGSSSASRTLTVTSDIALSASFAIKAFSVSISAGQNGSVSVNGTPGNYSQTVNYGTALTLEATASQDYNFTAWSDGVSVNPRILIVNADTILIASFQAQTQLAIKHTPGVAINAPTIAGLNVMESVDADGWLKVTYDGDIVTYDSTSLQGNADVLEVVLPDTCTAIGPNTFSGCSGLTKVSVSDNCTSIGSSAFANTGLTEFSAKGVTSFGSGAFGNCARLESVEFGENLATLGEGLFNNCSTLNYVGFDGINGPTITNNDLGSGIHATGTMYIPRYANDASYADFIAAMPSGWTVIRRKQNQILYQTTDGQQINVPSEINGSPLIKHIYFNGWGVIEYAGTRLYQIPEYGFSNNSNLSALYIPSIAANIGSSAFENCDSLTTVEIQDCTDIDWNAFNTSPIVNGPDTGKLTLPPSVGYIWQGAFANLESSEIEFGPALHSIDADTFNLQNATDLWVYTTNRMEDQGNPFTNVPASGTLHITYGADTPYWTQYLPGWTISYFPSIMRYTSNDNQKVIPLESAFNSTLVYNYCDGEGNGVLCFNGSLTRIGANAFDGCSNLTSFEFNYYPYGIPLTSIGSKAFAGTSLTSVELPKNVSSVAGDAFMDCNLTSIKLVDSPNCGLSEAVGKLYSRTNNTQLNLLARGSYNSNYVRNDTVTVGTSTSIIPGEVMYIGDNAFRGNKALTSIKFSECQMGIGNYAFKDCSNLRVLRFTNTNGHTPTVGTDTFNGVSATGTVYGRNGYSYTDIMAALPSGWTLILN